MPQPEPYPRPRQLFATTFHQDWHLHGSDWQAVVRYLTSGQHPDDIRATAWELDRLLAETPDDKTLGHRPHEVW